LNAIVTTEDDTQTIHFHLDAGACITISDEPPGGLHVEVSTRPGWGGYASQDVTTTDLRQAITRLLALVRAVERRTR
jgi:hypothetical protein